MTQDLRVLHIIGGLHTGGAEALLYRLAIRPSRFHHEVIVLVGPGRYSPLLQQAGITVHHLDVNKLPSAALALPKLRRLIAQSRADVVQSWMYNSNLAAGLFARPFGIPVVWGIHTSTLHGTGFISRVAAKMGGRWAPKLTDFVINCSTRSARIHSDLGYAQVKGAVIHNGYDPTIFFPDEPGRACARAELGVPDGTFLIGTIGRWTPQKDYPNLVSALGLTREAGLPFRCIFVGRGLDDGNAELVSALTRVGCREFTMLLGERSDVPNLARAMDLHVLPSRVEAFPNVVAESMLSGTPNVVTDVGDAEAMVGDTGWVAEPRNPGTLARAIGAAFEEYSSKPARWEERRIAARKRIADRYTLETMAAAYEDVWRRAAEGTLEALPR